MRKQKVIFDDFFKEANFFHAPPTVQNINGKNNLFVFIFRGRDLYQSKAVALSFNLTYNMPFVMVIYRQNLTKTISIGFRHFQAFHIRGR